jgi:hypothetical protein
MAIFRKYMQGENSNEDKKEDAKRIMGLGWI